MVNKEVRSSKKREQILNLFNKGDLLTANDICQKLPNIDKVTIYRNLSLFVSQGDLREVHVQKGITSYEKTIVGDNHQHLVCQQCHKVEHIDLKTNDLKKILPNINFVGFELNLVGNCSDCKV